MKKLFFASIMFLIAITCFAQSAEVKARYEKNLATLKSALASFEKEDINGWAAFVADNVVFHSPAYGDVVTTKAHWKELLQGFADNWDKLKLENPIFLPGLDSATHAMDGSVRYYGTWTAVHKSGVATKVSFYGSYEFNKEGKVSSADEFFDVGGLMNAVAEKKQ